MSRDAFEAETLHMLSKSQTWTLDSGQSVNLECEFLAGQFNLFDNPIVWRKRQYRPTLTSATAISTTSTTTLTSLLTTSPTHELHNVAAAADDIINNDDGDNSDTSGQST